MTKITNPLADLAQKLGNVRVIWTLVGTLIAAMGFTLPYVDPSLFTATAFDSIVLFLQDGVGQVIGLISGAIAIYQRYRKVEVVDKGLSVQSIQERALDTKVTYSPFGNVLV